MTHPRFFGQFLLHRGVITKEQLERAVEHQQSHNLKLGDLAAEDGLLNTADIERVRHEQRSSDDRFGDIALRFAILTGAQLEALLVKQKERHVPIGEALVAVGAISDADLAHLLEQFAAEEIKSSEDARRFHAQVARVAGILHPAAVDVTARLLLRLADVHTKESDARLGFGPMRDGSMQLSASVQGEWNGHYILRVSTAIARRITFRMRGPITSLEQVLDATAEFVSCIGGVVSRAFATRSMRCEFAKARELSAAEVAKSRQEDAITYALEILFPESIAEKIEILLVRTADG